ncbi:MAG: preprotein translocase subunit SecE [Clostridium sp. 27_14]|jgi:preprotein translocase, secE subunit|nr:MAG: preprotein translocase subunit SecE [Clostridium sp. 27_14]
MAKKEAKANNKENAKNKKSFWKSFKAELKKVTWPTPKQLANNTSAVIAIVVLTAIIVFALNITFEAMNKHGVDKVKELISNQTTNETTTDESNNNESSDDNSATNEADNNESADQNESAENNAASNE